MTQKIESPTVLGRAELVPEVYFEVRWPTGERFDNRRRITAAQGELLVRGRICEAVRSPTGRVRYFKLLRSPSVRGFAEISAACNFTTIQTKTLIEHKASRKKGL